MDLKSGKNELFQNSQVVLLIFYTIFVGMHIAITFMFEWDKWILLPILVGVAVSWALYIGSVFKPTQRIWLIAGFMMVTYFIYGTHLTSTYDLAIVIASLMILFITTGVKGTIILCQITFYITMTYDVVMLIIQGETTFDSILIARTIMHYLVVTMIAWFSQNTINKWNLVMDASKEEIDDLQDSTERLNDFLANVSHEIRTPVNAIIGLSGICIDKETNPEIEKDLIAVRSSGRRVADQISDILDFSEIDRGKAVKNCEDYMLSSMMNDLVNDIREIMKEEVELVIDIDHRIPAVMNSDVGKIKKIIKALVSNGIKYTTEGGVFLKIGYEQQAYGINLLIEVTDTGSGMSEEELERIRERYYQADSGRARNAGGLGLGIPIVSGFVDLLGGFMTIDSKLGVGTTVRVSIPQTVVDDTNCISIRSSKQPVLGSFFHFDLLTNPVIRECYSVQAISLSKGLGMEINIIENREHLLKITKEKELTHLFVGPDVYEEEKDLLEQMATKMKVIYLAGPNDKLPEGSRLHTMEKPFYSIPVVSIINADADMDAHERGTMKLYGVRALVVDDEPMNLVVAKSIFKRYEMVVDTASSGREAVECCRVKGYDIIFMDHMMGGMDGVEAMKKIRTDVKGVNHETAMVALTANAMSSARQMFLSEGFDGFVSKPIVVEELERTLRKVLPKNLISYEELSDETVKEDVDEAGNEAEITVDKTQSDNTVEGKEEADVKEAAPAGGFNEVMDKLKACGVNVDEAMTYASGDTDLYEQLLMQFATGVSDRVSKLSAYHDNKEIKNYEVLIHSTKSNSKMIGFMDLSEEARLLEVAAHEQDEAYLDAHHKHAMESIEAAGKTILECMGKASEDTIASEESDVLEFGAEDVMEFDAEDVLEFTPSEGGDR